MVVRVVNPTMGGPAQTSREVRQVGGDKYKYVLQKPRIVVESCRRGVVKPWKRGNAGNRGWVQSAQSWPVIHTHHCNSWPVIKQVKQQGKQGKQVKQVKQENRPSTRQS